MRAFRISRKEHIRDLSGLGAKLYGGRWTPPGKAVLYCAENLSLAMLEMLAHADEKYLQKNFSALELKLSDQLAMREIKLSELPPAWKAYPHPAVTQKIGEEWLTMEKHHVLMVPSVVNELERNFLINPSLISEGDLEIVAVHEITFDERLIL